MVLEEKELIKGISKDLEGFCKILATNISERLNLLDRFTRIDGNRSRGTYFRI